MKIVFGDAMRDAWSGFDDHLLDLAKRPNVRRICEIGAGANPALDLETASELGLEYILVDTSADELAKAPDGYDKLHAGITSERMRDLGRFDLVFSKMVAEHVQNPGEFHSGIYKLLASGGVAFHFFPTLFSLPFVVNRLLPEALLERILISIQPHRERSGNFRKFPAYYKWCRGPTASQIRRFESLGYEIESYTGFFGHEYYVRLKPLHTAHRLLVRLLEEHPVPQLTSFAYIVLKRP